MHKIIKNVVGVMLVIFLTVWCGVGIMYIRNSVKAEQVSSKLVDFQLDLVKDLSKDLLKKK